MALRLLLVDDHKLTLELTKNFLEQNGYVVDTASSREMGLRLVKERGDQYALFILDYVMGTENGAEMAKEILSLRPEAFVIIYSNDASREALKHSWRSGAVEFVDKGVDLKEFVAIVRRWCQKYKETYLALPAPEVNENSKKIESIGLVGISEKMAKVADLVLKFRTSRSTVLITGESGTGKECIARALHGNSRSRFIAVNCAVYAERTELLESELFGVEKGAFTGANATKKGIFEEVGDGTVLLDEVHTLSLVAQQKLLRALQEKSVRPVGGTREYKVHFRLVAAAKPEIEAMVKRREFIPDLYYRLNVLRIPVPALRQRPEDVPSLILNAVKKFAADGAAPKQFLLRTVRYLEKYAWPGNVRELENEVEKLCTICPNKKITPEDLDARFFDDGSSQHESQEAVTPELTREMVLVALQESPSIREASRRLGVAHSTLYDAMKRLGIESKNKRKAVSGL
jgi:DNA-binding NtrC family response regulator